jgi:hypothetical protein
MESSSYFNTIAFLIVTLFYALVMKPKLTLSIISSDESYMDYKANNYLYLAAYFILVILVQFSVNSSIITTTCGGSVKENFGAAGMLTFIPWLLIFGVVILVIISFPGFKSAFSDVIGYYIVATKATGVLTELLVDSRVGVTNAETQSAADAIIKIMGDNSVLINQILPDNFNQYWTTLRPLMKEGLADNQDIKGRLFDLVVTRDSIGELMWYVYTGVLLTFLVGFKIASRGCSSSPETMAENLRIFNESQKKTKAE